MADQVKIRLSGLPKDVEKVALALRVLIRVLEESGNYSNRQGEMVRRYMTVKPEPPAVLAASDQEQG